MTASEDLHIEESRIEDLRLTTSPHRSIGKNSGTTSMPNYLLDMVMPTVTDTQWRLLCVIVRQTLGWQAKKGNRTERQRKERQRKERQRKERDWLSHAQLKARTGRQSAAICKAIDELVRLHIIQVQNEEGKFLVTPQERQLSRGRLFYRVHPRWLQSGWLGADPKQAISQSEFHIPKTTKENETKESFKKNSLSFSQSEILAIENTNYEDSSQKSLMQSEAQATNQGFDETRFDKTNFDGKWAVVDMASAPAGIKTQEEQFVSKKAETFIRCYEELYQQHLPGQGVPAITQDDYKALENMLSREPAIDLMKWLPTFFASTFGYVKRRNHSLESFLDSVHVLRARAAGRPSNHLAPHHSA